MTIADYNVIRFHLQVLHGIIVKRVEKKNDRLFIGGSRLFGVHLENLPRTYIPDFGLVPSFLVQACSLLSERLGTVGLFRKPGSLPRIKTLRFCRELPEPLFPSVLHPALLKAQALSRPEDRTSALQLLSCLLPARYASALHYLFNFLYKVSQRCSDNLMTSLNLATVFAPCLLPPPNRTEMSESRLELRVLVLRTFIDSPRLFGVIPKSVLDSMDFFTNSPLPKDFQARRGNRKRHSFSVKRIGKTIQALSKAKLPDSESMKGPSPKPRLRRSLGHENFPNIQVFRSCLPWDEQSYKLADEDGMEQQRLKRKRSSRQDAGGSPVLTGVGRLYLGSWRRRSSL